MDVLVFAIIKEKVLYSCYSFFFVKISSVSRRFSTFTSIVSPVALILTSTIPSAAFFPTVTRIGRPIKSLSLNFTPARALRSSVNTSYPALNSSASSCSVKARASSSLTFIGIKCTSNGANSLGKLIPQT